MGGKRSAPGGFCCITSVMEAHRAQNMDVWLITWNGAPYSRCLQRQIVIVTGYWYFYISHQRDSAAPSVRLGMAAGDVPAGNEAFNSAACYTLIPPSTERTDTNATI